MISIKTNIDDLGIHQTTYFECFDSRFLCLQSSFIPLSFILRLRETVVVFAVVVLKHEHIIRTNTTEGAKDALAFA